HGNSVPKDSIQSPARIRHGLPPGALAPTERPRETPAPGHSPGPTRPPGGKDREPAWFRRERPQGFPPPSGAPNLVGPEQGPCAMSLPHPSNHNRNSFRSSPGVTGHPASLVRGRVLVAPSRGPRRDER